MNEQEIFHQALSLPPEARSVFLDHACLGDSAMRASVEALLRANEGASNFLDAPALGAGFVRDVAAIDARIGGFIGHYRLKDQIGEGGMGTVYLAEQTHPVRRQVALKVIKPGMDSRRVVARFEAERQALALMDHPNIAKVLDAGATELGRPYFVMEYVPGVPITRFCDDARLTVEERLRLFIPVCDAIQHAHQKGIIHRDVKPTNVIVTLYDGKPVPKVIDFGVAKAVEQELADPSLGTQFGQVVGTLEYMAPEQAESSAKGIDTRADVYSLGVVLYELLVGSTPLSRDRMEQRTYAELVRVITEHDPPTPSTRLGESGERMASISAVRQTEPKKLAKLVRGELDWIVMRCLEKDRERRYASANELAADLLRHLNDEAIHAGPPSRWYRVRKFARRNKGALLATLLVLLFLLSGITGTTLGMLEARAGRKEAEDARKEESKERKKADDARESATKRLAQVIKGNEILTAVFEDLDLRPGKSRTEPLEAVLAKRLVKAATQLDGEAVGDPVAVAALQNKLVTTLMNLGYAEDAVAVAQKSFATYKTELGPDHPFTLLSMNNLALAQQLAGRVALALPIYEEALRRRKAVLGADHPDAVQSLSNLGGAYREAGRLDEALPLLEEACRRYDATIGPDDRDALAARNYLALVLHETGRVDRAVPLYEDVLRRRKATMGADHLETASSMNNLAMGYRDSGRPSEALPLLEECVKLNERRLGAVHLATLQSMNNLAVAYQNAGQLDRALQLLEKTLSIRRTNYPPDHPETLTSMNNLGLAYLSANDFDRALPLLEETTALLKRIRGSDHPYALMSLNNLAAARLRAGKLESALPLFEEAAMGMEKRRFRHERAAKIVSDAVQAYRAARRYDVALAWQKKWAAAVKDQAGATSPAYADALSTQGDILLLQRRFNEAESVLIECIAVLEKAQPDGWSAFNARSLLGGVLLGRKAHTEAESSLLSGYQGMKQREQTIPPPQRAARLADAVDRLIDFYTAKNKPDEVKKWKEERAKYAATKPAPLAKVEPKPAEKK